MRLAPAALTVSAVLCASVSAQTEKPGPKLPPNMHLVTPMTPSRSTPQLQVARSRFFEYALPPGWAVGEEGQYALTLISPDRKAITVMVGNSGIPINYNPGQFVFDKLMALGPQNLQIGQAQQATPIAGFKLAYQFPVTYQWHGVQSRGVVKCHVAPTYDSAVMAMTAALSSAAEWPKYASWLPLVADQVSATNGAAFGMRGVMAQNLQNSMAFGEAVRQYNDWSQRNWKGVTDARDASSQRNHEAFRENLGNHSQHVNPYDPGSSPLELSNQYQYYWVNRQGQIVGTDDPTADPNMGSTGEWEKMPRVKK